ncbi:hypothetical protein EVAR_59767_1 [Eumeta japonica]|uniref:Uncharacterized protein n=1 Tax=Eumeta variegata TaxID=151549 RepID=A0A4C1ZH12_EUMVA|nr:hypothetical protein EVAR_59767_1 [Eumeta japonica]
MSRPLIKTIDTLTEHDEIVASEVSERCPCRSPDEWRLFLPASRHKGAPKRKYLPLITGERELLPRIRVEGRACGGRLTRTAAVAPSPRGIKSISHLLRAPDPEVIFRIEVEQQQRHNMSLPPGRVSNIYLSFFISLYDKTPSALPGQRLRSVRFFFGAAKKSQSGDPP